MSIRGLDMFVRLADFGEKVPYVQMVQLTRSEWESIERSLERRGMRISLDAGAMFWTAVPNGKGERP